MRVLTAAVVSVLFCCTLLSAQAPTPNPTNKTGVIGLMHAIHSTNDADKDACLLPGRVRHGRTGAVHSRAQDLRF